MDDQAADSVEIADAEGSLDALVESVASGRRVCLTRDGRPVAWLTAVAPNPPRRPISRDLLHNLTRDAPCQEESAGNFMRRIRDEERY
jgi:antitoxin (DNA-binding transcriptional repressor) of toxin-antitoxin stability system